MATERIIGVDFGTSTSVIRVKRYQDGRPVGDPLEVKQITFGKGNRMVPTLVQKRDSGETVFLGAMPKFPIEERKPMGISRWIWRVRMPMSAARPGH